MMMLALLLVVYALVAQAKPPACSESAKAAIGPKIQEWTASDDLKRCEKAVGPLPEKLDFGMDVITLI